MNEIWKDTYIYGQQYQISNYGRVRNDIICNYYDDLFPEDETMSLIVWDKSGWKIKKGSSPEEISIANDIGNCEVVGNIFDNPELLRG